MTTSSSQEASDSWDLPEASSSQARAPAKSTVVVRDDWEDDEEEVEEAGTTDANQRIWDEANSKASNPMPSVVIAPSATSSYKVLSPPPGAFQPQMRILKRPTDSNSSSTPPPKSTSPDSLQEREAKYQAARERIFGQSSPSPAPSDESEPKPSVKPGVTIARNPRGPSGDTSTTSTGFRPRTKTSDGAGPGQGIP